MASAPLPLPTPPTTIQLQNALENVFTRFLQYKGLAEKVALLSTFPTSGLDFVRSKDGNYPLAKGAYYKVAPSLVCAYFYDETNLVHFTQWLEFWRHQTLCTIKTNLRNPDTAYINQAFYTNLNSELRLINGKTFTPDLWNRYLKKDPTAVHELMILFQQPKPIPTYHRLCLASNIHFIDHQSMGILPFQRLYSYFNIPSRIGTPSKYFRCHDNELFANDLGECRGTGGGPRTNALLPFNGFSERLLEQVYQCGFNPNRQATLEDLNNVYKIILAMLIQVGSIYALSFPSNPEQELQLHFIRWFNIGYTFTMDAWKRWSSFSPPPPPNSTRPYNPHKDPTTLPLYFQIPSFLKNILKNKINTTSLLKHNCVGPEHSFVVYDETNQDHVLKFNQFVHIAKQERALYKEYLRRVSLTLTTWKTYTPKKAYIKRTIYPKHKYWKAAGLRKNHLVLFLQNNKTNVFTGFASFDFLTCPSSYLEISYYSRDQTNTPYLNPNSTADFAHDLWTEDEPDYNVDWAWGEITTNNQHHSFYYISQKYKIISNVFCHQEYHFYSLPIMVNLDHVHKLASVPDVDGNMETKKPTPIQEDQVGNTLTSVANYIFALGNQKANLDGVGVQFPNFYIQNILQRYMGENRSKTTPFRWSTTAVFTILHLILTEWREKFIPVDGFATWALAPQVRTIFNSLYAVNWPQLNTIHMYKNLLEISPMNYVPSGNVVDIPSTDMSPVSSTNFDAQLPMPFRRHFVMLQQQNNTKEVLTSSNNYYYITRDKLKESYNPGSTDVGFYQDRGFKNYAHWLQWVIGRSGFRDQDWSNLRDYLLGMTQSNIGYLEKVIKSGERNTLLRPVSHPIRVKDGTVGTFNEMAIPMAHINVILFDDSLQMTKLTNQLANFRRSCLTQPLTLPVPTLVLSLRQLPPPLPFQQFPTQRQSVSSLPPPTQPPPPTYRIITVPPPPQQPQQFWSSQDFIFLPGGTPIPRTPAPTTSPPGTPAPRTPAPTTSPPGSSNDLFADRSEDNLERMLTSDDPLDFMRNIALTTTRDFDETGTGTGTNITNDTTSDFMDYNNDYGNIPFTPLPKSPLFSPQPPKQKPNRSPTITTTTTMTRTTTTTTTTMTTTTTTVTPQTTTTTTTNAPVLVTITLSIKTGQSPMVLQIKDKLNFHSTLQDVLEHMGSSDNVAWNKVLDEYTPLNGTLSPKKDPSIKWTFIDIIDEEQETDEIKLGMRGYYDFTCTLEKVTTTAIKDVPAWVSPVSYW